MGSLLSIFSKKKNRTPSEHKRQSQVLKNISENDKVLWQDPSHRLSVIAGSKAAHRLSTHNSPPKDDDALSEYIEDQKTVSIAIDALKENKNGNMNEYKKAVQIIDETPTNSIQTYKNKPILHQNINDNNDDDEDNGPLFKLVISDENNENFHTHKKTTTLSILNDKNKDEKDVLSILNDEISNDDGTEQKEEKVATKEPKHRRQPSYKGFKIQIDRMQSYADDNGILNVKSSTFVENVNEYHKNKRVTLTNSHNFLWFVTAIQSATHSAERESEITRKTLDKILNLLPIPFRDKIWEICNIDNETYLFQEDYAEFVDALLVATGQIRVDDDEELDFEIRDMTDVFIQIVDIDELFKEKENISKWSQTVSCLSTLGATRIVMRARNLSNRNDIKSSDDVSIALLTGFTRKAMKHALTFCTRVFWKLLTDIWWDEDDDEDLALPMSLSKYGTNGKLLLNPSTSLKLQKKKSNSKSQRLSPLQRDGLNGTSLEILFPDLSLSTYDNNEEDNFSRFLRVIE